MAKHELVYKRNRRYSIFGGHFNSILEIKCNKCKKTWCEFGKEIDKDISDDDVKNILNFIDEDCEIESPENKIEFIQAMQVLSLKPADIIILKHEGCLSKAASDYIKDKIKEICPGHKCFILEAGMDIGVLRKESATEDTEGTEKKSVSCKLRPES